MTELGENLRRAFGGGRPVEWTVEMAPASVTPQRLAALKDLGVTRISLGVQSFQLALLDALGRRHSREQVLRAFALVRVAGFASVNFDMIFSVPGQDLAAWRSDLDEAVRLAPDHLSTYCLTFEEDTALYVKLSQGRVHRDVEREADFYLEAWERLEAAGYAQYEISNFARPGHPCRHNLNTWRMQDWVGLGPSAASQQHDRRGSNVADIGRWLADVAAGRRANTEGVRLTPRVLLEDSLVFGLRMNEGVDLPALRRRFPGANWETLHELAGRLTEDGLATLNSAGQFQLTLRGRLLADAIGGQFMETLAERAAPVRA
ncbi:MAG: hypothetical protein A3G75_09450 [Verrucomicrobia bacterium RIFCSPLOWO2_12_FULL_64_8]|nr:MAG: hypothetical protein A3G75_09450 [Verrucomicrobia bacterium RIFCSPLOWO2_12_FULL_64_8]